MSRTYTYIYAYLIFVTNAANAVRVKLLGECKQIPEKQENDCFGLRLYHNSDHVNVLFYTKCAILHRYQCFILHLVFDFTLGVQFYIWWVYNILYTGCPKKNGA